MKNGDVYLGKTTVHDSNTVGIESFGNKAKVRQTDILTIGNQLSAKSDEQIEVLLPDDSVLKGRIKNFDDDIGLFLETTFGEITIPARGIKKISDVGQRNRYFGKPYQTGVSGGYYIPSGVFKSNFGDSPFATIFAELNVTSVRGLLLGIDFSYVPMDYQSSSDVSYVSYALLAHAAYRYLDFSMGTVPVVNRLIPFVKAGAGLAYISVEDNRAVAPIAVRSEVSPVLTGGFGTDVLIVRDVSLRLEAGVLSIYQSKLYNAFTFGIGAVCGFSM